MRHKRCGGLIAVEEYPDTPDLFDLVCVNCGARIYLKRDSWLGNKILNALEPERAECVFTLKLPSGRNAFVKREENDWSAFVWGSNESKREVPA